MKKAILLLIAAVLMAGCSDNGGGPPPVVYVTPCALIGGGVTIRANSSTLQTSLVKTPLARVFVDDITSEKAERWKGNYTLSCYWGANVGEVSDYYYCTGSYLAPDINDKGVIVRTLKKEFKIGFSVSSYEGSSWTDLSGIVHRDESYSDLTVESVDVKCKVV
jgi:hypothetical protein